MSYKIEKTEHGILIFGPIPIDEFVTLSKLWDKQGYTVIAPGIATALGASMAIAKESELSTWEDKVNKQALQIAGSDVELAWLNSTDTGISSKTIFSVLSERHGKYALSYDDHGVPHDPSDFGRCYRLLQLFPEWRKRLPEVSAVYPEWGPFVDAWEELEQLWEKESPSGECPELYKKMREILDSIYKIRNSKK